MFSVFDPHKGTKAFALFTAYWARKLTGTV